MAEGQKTKTPSRWARDDRPEKEFEAAFKPSKSRVSFGKAKGEVPPRPKVKGKRAGRTLLVILAVLLLIGGALAALYLSGILTPLLELAGLVPPAVEPGLSLEEREALVDIRQRELTAQRESLDRREEELAARIAQWEEIQAAMESGEDARSFQETLGGMPEEKLTDIKRVGAIYAKMNPSEAASVLADMDSMMEVCLIIYHMPSSSSALVMQEMGAKASAEVTRILLS